MMTNDYFGADRCALRYLSCSAILLAALTASGCSDVSGKKTATQVVAKVDGKEISIHQINAVLARANVTPAASPEELRKDVLDKLIDQQLLYAQALERKLDRDPKVMMLVDTAKREVLARAYMDSLMTTPPQISEAEIHQYYVENPALFAQRKLYNLQEIALVAMPTLLDELTTLAQDGKSMDEIKKFLASHAIEFKGDGGVRAAEQIPLDILPRLAVLEDGETALIESGKRYYILHIVASKAEPVSEVEARSRIGAFLANQQGQRLVAQETRRLKAGAKIEYLGDFTKVVTSPPGNTVAAIKSERKTQ